MYGITCQFTSWKLIKNATNAILSNLLSKWSHWNEALLCRFIHYHLKLFPNLSLKVHIGTLLNRVIKQNFENYKQPWLHLCNIKQILYVAGTICSGLLSCIACLIAAATLAVYFCVYTSILFSQQWMVDQSEYNSQREKWSFYPSDLLYNWLIVYSSKL